MADLLEPIKDILQPRATKKRLDLEFYIARNVPAFVMGDMTKSVKS